MKIYLLILCCFYFGCQQKTNSKGQLKTDNNITEKDIKTAVTATPKDDGKVVEKKGIFLGKVDGEIIRYDHTYTELSEGLRREGYVSVYTKDRDKKTTLLNYDFGGYESGRIELINLLNHPFIYIAQSARFGLDGMLYALDLKNGKTNLVSYSDEKVRFSDVVKNHYNIKGLDLRNSHGIVVDSAKSITSEDYYRSASDTTYTYKCKFKLMKIKHNTYTLKLVKAKMVPNLELL